MNQGGSASPSGRAKSSRDGLALVTIHRLIDDSGGAEGAGSIAHAMEAVAHELCTIEC